MLLSICNIFYAEKETYLALLNYEGQNSLREYLFRFFYEQFNIQYPNAMSEEYADKITYDKEQAEAASSFATSCFCGTILYWCQDGMNRSYLEMLSKLVRLQTESNYAQEESAHIKIFNKRA